MKNNTFGILALIVAVTTACFGYWKRPAKIGYAETSEILSKFNEAVDARRLYLESQKEWDRNLKILNDSLTAAMDVMKQRYDKATQTEKEHLRDNLRKRNEDLQRYTNAVKQLAQDRERALMDPVIKKVNSFLSDWGNEHGYDLIFGTMSGGNILHASKVMNVTVDVLNGINEHYRNLPTRGKDSAETSTGIGAAPSVPAPPKAP